jgi:general stress protein CsbA
MKNKTRRRLGFMFMVMAVIVAALNLEWTANIGMIGVPVVFLILGAVLLRKTRASAEDDALKTRRRRSSRGSDSKSASQ